MPGKKSPDQLAKEAQGKRVMGNLEALGLCLVDGIRWQLSQPKPDLHLTAGLFIEWFTEVKPALEGMPFLTLREAVELGALLANLREIIEAALASPEIGSKSSWEPAKYQQIAEYFVTTQPAPFDYTALRSGCFAASVGLLQSQ